MGNQMDNNMEHEMKAKVTWGSIGAADNCHDAEGFLLTSVGLVLAKRSWAVAGLGFRI